MHHLRRKRPFLRFGRWTSGIVLLAIDVDLRSDHVDASFLAVIVPTCSKHGKTGQSHVLF